MTLDDLIKKSREQRADFDRISITGPGWSGNSKIGFMCNPESGCPSTGGGGTPTPGGACCFDDGTCAITTQAFCEDNGGTYQGDDTTCDPNPCPQPPTGACCIDSDCLIGTETDCIGSGGIYQGDDTTCDPNPCPAPTGACCRVAEDGTYTLCDIETAEACSIGGFYQGDDTVCDPNPCPACPSFHVDIDLTWTRDCGPGSACECFEGSTGYESYTIHYTDSLDVDTSVESCAFHSERLEIPIDYVCCNGSSGEATLSEFHCNLTVDPAGIGTPFGLDIGWQLTGSPSNCVNHGFTVDESVGVDIGSELFGSHPVSYTSVDGTLTVTGSVTCTPI